MEDGHKAEVFFRRSRTLCRRCKRGGRVKNVFSSLGNSIRGARGLFGERGNFSYEGAEIYAVKCPLRFSLVTDPRTEKYAYTTAKNSNKESL